MDFIRPELRSRIWRYRDALIGVVVSAFGLGWAISSIGFMSILGTSVTIAGALLVFAGIQRARFRLDQDGAGVVSIDEGQVTYFGPHAGGTVHVDELIQVDLAPPGKAQNEGAWLLLSNDTESLTIPVNATGADKLFDVFAKLNGIKTSYMLDRLAERSDEQVVIWRNSNTASH